MYILLKLISSSLRGRKIRMILNIRNTLLWVRVHYSGLAMCVHKHVSEALDRDNKQYSKFYSCHQMAAHLSAPHCYNLPYDIVKNKLIITSASMSTNKYPLDTCLLTFKEWKFIKLLTTDFNLLLNMRKHGFDDERSS